MSEGVWRCGSRTFVLGERTLVMGILNVTPDSFSDGGAFKTPRDAAARAAELFTAGADIIDVGGESTRPGAEPVPASEEMKRVIPVIERIHKKDPEAAISVDTRKPEVARAAVEAGACIVNDVAAATEPGMLQLARDSGAGLILMHMLGDPRTMQQEPHYEDTVGEVRGFLAERLGTAEAVGVAREQLCVDPGIGFGKNLTHNLELLRSIGSFRHLGVPVMVGVSRKRFIGELTGTSEPADRLEGTAGAVAWCAAQRIDAVRVHDVREMSRVVRVVDAIVRGPV
jgi:dihydropteroate synthase